MPTPLRVSRVCDSYDYRQRACTAFLDVFKLDDRDGYYFVSDLQIDLDGSPRAYHPSDRRRPDNNSQALDWLTSVNVNDLHGIQGQNAIGPMPGYYVSGTTYEDPTKAVNNAARYVDSGTIPYIVLTSRFPESSAHPRAGNGDCAVVVNLRTWRWSTAIFADVGRAVGEASLKLAQNLGFDPTVSPNTPIPPKVMAGISRKEFFYLVFPGTRVGFPLSEAQIRQRAEPLFAAWGGVQRVQAMFPPARAATAAAATRRAAQPPPVPAPPDPHPRDNPRRERNIWEPVKAAIQLHGEELAAYPGVVLVRPGWKYRAGRMTLEPCVTVCVMEKQATENLQARDLLPARFGRVAVDVSPAGIRDQIRAWELGTAQTSLATAGGEIARMAAGRGAVDDRLPPDEDEPAELASIGLALAAAEARSLDPYVPPPVPLKAVTEEMTLQLNSGPDSGWKCLSAFLGRVEKHLNATMYEFTAEHIFNRLIEVLGKKKTLSLIMDYETENGFSNEEAVPRLQEKLGKRFKFAWAAVQGKGKTHKAWIESAYHIKVAVRDDGSEMWLSSGNWKNSSQPEDDPFNPPPNRTPASFFRRHNRDWHVVVSGGSLPGLFNTYILHDLKQASEVQVSANAATAARTTRKAQPEIWVPEEEAVLAAAAVQYRFFQEEVISGKIKVQPLLTPDEGGFVDHVLKLVSSARKRLYIENQSLNAAPGHEKHEQLRALIAEKSRDSSLDTRIILRGDYADSVERMTRGLIRAQTRMDSVRWLRGVHTKGILVDDKAVLIGSHNLTGQGTHTNRDASLIIYDKRAVAFYEKLFLFDWGRARTTEQPAHMEARLAVPGQKPPAGMVAVPWRDYFDD